MAISGKDKVAYGLGAFGYGSVNQMIGNFLMFFGTGVLGLSGTLMGLAISISTVWDAVTDPIVGSMSDNHKGRFGKRHTFMFVGCILVAVINLIIWNINPAWSEITKFLILLVGLLLIETFNTVYSTPYSALGMDMCKSYNERTSIQGYKTAFQFLSLLVPSVLMAMVLAPKDYVTINTSTTGYKVISIITSVLCIITGIIAIFGTRNYRSYKVQNMRNIHYTEKPKPMAFLTTFFGVLKSKNNVFLISAYAIALSCSAFITSLGMHIFTFTFHFSSLQVPIIMVCLVAGIILGQPLWYKISEKLGKKDTVLTALAVVVVGVVIFSFILAFRQYINITVLLVLVSINIFILSAGVGCIYSLPISMFADNVSEENTATATGFLTFCTKLTNAVVMMIVGVILDLIGFEGGVASQNAFVSTALGWSLVCGVVIAAVVAWILFRKYQDNAREINV